jgi:hypothetical protein
MAGEMPTGSAVPYLGTVEQRNRVEFFGQGVL